MRQITVEEATNNLSELLEKVAQGEQFIILKQGEEIARILPPLKPKIDGLSKFLYNQD